MTERPSPLADDHTVGAAPGRLQGGVVVVGAGIVGLATAYALARQGVRVTVVDKERSVAAHQTGHNSGVVHSGVYYTPGSLKASFAARGARTMVEFAEQHGIAHEVCGKLIVASSQNQLAALRELERRAGANGVPAVWLDPEQAAEYEPHVACVAALRIESTAVVDYPAVCQVLARLVEQRGGRVLLGREVRRIKVAGRQVEVDTTGETITADHLVNCAGLHSDVIAMMAGLDPDVRILPFRGEYYDVRGPAQNLVRGLIYPVPDPALPFLGVHLTRGIDGSVHAGPNAVLALAREGYRWRDVVPSDVRAALTWPGSWGLARRYWRVGASEVARSASRRMFVASVRRLVPELSPHDVVRAGSGVRAQAVRRSGDLVDDFHIVEADRQLHVLNAPSPAATAALEIGEELARTVISRT
ncbi:MAG: dependent oxidoreductase [Modestobacter sp.]|nr:dependent oxidoreductase [Modestobacter sp.]